MKKMTNFIIVDDDNTSLLICTYTIHKFNPQAKVITFTEPEIALDKIAKGFGNYNEDIQTILFLDINMPTMTGWDFLDVFNNFDFKIKKRFLIYILSSSIEDFENKAIKYPFVTGYLSKPLKLHYLQDICSSQMPNLINY